MRRKLVLELWSRLVCLVSVTALLVLTLSILVEVDGWLQYEAGRQLATEIGARVSVALIFAVLLATAATLLALPYVLRRPADVTREQRVLRVASAVALIVCGSAVIGIAVRWAVAVELLPIKPIAAVRLWGALSGLLLLSVVAAVITGQDEWVNRYTQSISGRNTRRLLLLAGIGGLLSGLSIEADRRPSAQGRRSSRVRAKSPNVLLVTFDALSAEDMSCYGYGLPTTPNIDALARSSYVFSNFYAVSTYTTPCIASMLTGGYPSSNRVYHFGGSLHDRIAERTVSNLLHGSGYATAASVANPGAHPTCLGISRDFDILPAPPLTEFPIREATMLFGSPQLATDLHFASVFFPYMLELASPRRFAQLHSIAPPEKSFQQAQRILRDLPSPFFLWVHVFAPHYPYLPEPPYLRRFLPTDELRTHAEFVEMLGRSGYNYDPVKQPLVARGRLRYDEWIAQADGAFGAFMASLRGSGRLANTAVIVSADHGESFQGGFLGHGGPQHLRPVVHIPLIVQLPDQSFGREISATVDQTILAPTILNIAGLEQPDWMTAASLQTLVNGGAVAGGTGAFCQFLGTNSIFKPITHGTIGVIEGQRQCVLDLDSGRGALFDLAEAHEQRHDLSAAEPAVAAALGSRIRQRFPDIFRT